MEISLYSKNHCGAILIGFCDTKLVDTLCGIELGIKTKFLTSAACTKVKKAFKSLGTIRLKIPFVELYKGCTICAILSVNTPISLKATEPKSCYAMLRRGPIIMQISHDYQKKCLLRGKSAILSVRWNISLYSKNRCGAILTGFGDA